MKTKKISGPLATNSKTAQLKDTYRAISVTDSVNRDAALEQLLDEVLPQMPLDMKSTVTEVADVEVPVAVPVVGDNAAPVEEAANG